MKLRSTRYPGAVSGPRPSRRRSPWAGSFPPRTSAEGKPSLFGRFSGTMTPSEFSSACMFIVRLCLRKWPGIPLRARMRLPRFRCRRTSPRAQGLRLREVLPMQAHSPWDDVAFSSTERDRHLGIRPVSQLDTWPVVSPVNASRRPSRDAVHHSGSGRLARPSPWGTFTSYSLPASWRTPFRVINGSAALEIRLPFYP